MFLSGSDMYKMVSDLYHICRSITGPGVRETLSYIQKIIPKLSIQSVPSGTQAFDWTVPNEWTIRDAFIADESGKRIVDFQKHNLHVVGYSEPVDKWLTLEELNNIFIHYRINLMQYLMSLLTIPVIGGFALRMNSYNLLCQAGIMY